MSVKGRRAEHAEDTRRALVDAGRALFAEQGYAATGTEEIVARARVTRGALYHHFNGKTDLFLAAVGQVATEVAHRLVTEQSPDPESEETGSWDGLRRGVQTYLDVCTDSDFQRIVLVDGPVVLGHDAWEELVEQHGYSLLRGWLEAAMDRGEIDPLPVDPLARLIGALVAEAGLYIARSGGHAAARESAGVSIDRVLVGLRPGPAG